MLQGHCWRVMVECFFYELSSNLCVLLYRNPKHLIALHMSKMYVCPRSLHGLFVWMCVCVSECEMMCICVFVWMWVYVSISVIVWMWGCVCVCGVEAQVSAAWQWCMGNLKSRSFPRGCLQSGQPTAARRKLIYIYLHKHTHRHTHTHMHTRAHTHTHPHTHTCTHTHRHPQQNFNTADVFTQTLTICSMFPCRLKVSTFRQEARKKDFFYVQ